MSGGYFVRLTEEQYQAMLKRNTALGMPAAPKKSKYRNVRCQSHDGKSFASKLERDYYEQLYLSWKAGVVLWYVRQPSFDLEGGVIYRADFLVVSLTFGAPKIEVIDTKGCLTPESKNKIKQMKARYGIDVQLVRSA